MSKVKTAHQTGGTTTTTSVAYEAFKTVVEKYADVVEHKAGHVRSNAASFLGHFRGWRKDYLDSFRNSMRAGKAREYRRDIEKDVEIVKQNAKAVRLTVEHAVANGVIDPAGAEMAHWTELVETTAGHAEAVSEIEAEFPGELSAIIKLAERDIAIEDSVKRLTAEINSAL